MTWYLGITTTRHIRPFPKAEKIRGEFAVQEQLQALGIEAHAPKQIKFERRGKSKTFDPVTRVLVPGYIIADIPDRLYTQAMRVDGIAPTTKVICKREVEDKDRGVLKFIAEAENKLAEAQSIIDRRDRAAMVKFRVGERLRTLSEAFSEMALEFTRMVEKAGQDYPMVGVKTEMFGREVELLIDPMDVRSAG